MDVWKFSLAGDRVVSPEPALSARELRQARATVSASARRRYVAGRLRLRQILSRYCGVAPSQVPIAQTRLGKPYLRAPFSGIKFNLSHSGDFAVLAVARDAALGIDVEKHRRIGAEMIAADWLHQGEREDLERSGQDDFGAAFFRLWCRKEAVLKAEGAGLSFPLHGFRVSVSASCPAVLEWPGKRSWQLYDLAIEDGFTTAVALDRRASSISYRELR